MDVRPCRSSSRSDFGNGFAAGNPIAYMNEILTVVRIQHLVTVFGLNDDGVAVASFCSALDDAAAGYGSNGGAFRCRNVGSGVVSGFAVYGISTPALRRTDNAAHGQSHRLDRNLRRLFDG